MQKIFICLVTSWDLLLKLQGKNSFSFSYGFERVPSFKLVYFDRVNPRHPNSSAKKKLIIHFWETAHLPLPQATANINTYFSLGSKCWLRGGIMIQKITTSAVHKSKFS